MDKDMVLDVYRLNYEMAVDDGHTEEAERIAWAWTEEDFRDIVLRVKNQYQAEKQENINKAFFDWLASYA